MSDFDDFVSDYQKRLIATLQRIDREALRPVLDVLLDVASRGATLWVAGNGGSAALSEHAACDLAKGTCVDGHPPLRAVSLASNLAMITAIANDLDYTQVFRRQLELQLRSGDAVLLISASGNSPNVVEAGRYARKCGARTIAFVGFGGGELARTVDHVVHVPVENYGIAEDVHQALMHMLGQYIARLRQA